MQAGQKCAGRFADPVGNDRAPLQLEIERSADKPLDTRRYVEPERLRGLEIEREFERSRL
jgi:hypothetical protein